MSSDQEGIRRRLQQIVEMFRQKGATTPEKAMTIKELGLPPRFGQAMHRRLGQTGIFVEVKGKYYLDEERLKQIQEQRANSGGYGGDTSNRGRSPSWLRYANIFLMLPIGIIVVVLLYFILFYGGAGYYPGEFIIIVLVVLVVVFVARMLLWRTRRRYWRQNWQNNPPM
jgi:hypothetical protein